MYCDHICDRRRSRLLPPSLYTPRHVYKARERNKEANFRFSISQFTSRIISLISNFDISFFCNTVSFHPRSVKSIQNQFRLRLHNPDREAKNHFSTPRDASEVPTAPPRNCNEIYREYLQ